MKKVLIVEDDNFLLGLEASKLKKSGFDVIFASTGEDAMVKIQEPGIDIILLDLILPNFDGFTILEKIKQREAIKNTPVIIFSNLTEDKDLKRAESLGVNLFMIKSNFTLDELVSNITEILK